jgi:hypothetical protein
MIDDAETWCSDSERFGVLVIMSTRLISQGNGANININDNNELRAFYIKVKRCHNFRSTLPYKVSYNHKTSSLLETRK